MIRMRLRWWRRLGLGSLLGRHSSHLGLRSTLLGLRSHLDLHSLRH